MMLICSNETNPSGILCNRFKIQTMCLKNLAVKTAGGFDKCCSVLFILQIINTFVYYDHCKPLCLMQLPACTIV